ERSRRETSGKAGSGNKPPQKVEKKQLTPMEMMKLRMRKALDSQLQKDKSAIAKKSSKDSKMAELGRKQQRLDEEQHERRQAKARDVNASPSRSRSRSRSPPRRRPRRSRSRSSSRCVRELGWWGGVALGSPQEGLEEATGRTLSETCAQMVVVLSLSLLALFVS
ncbi:unnamed protein product, partial [Laminaria digitata]